MKVNFILIIFMDMVNTHMQIIMNIQFLKDIGVILRKMVKEK
jgi:hypothetical protein